MKSIEDTLKEFISKFCNDHNGEVRFLRGVFYDEKDGSEQILAFIQSALQQRDDEWRKKVVELSNLYGEPRCGQLHHPKKYRHAIFDDCPVEEAINTKINHLLRD